MTIHRVWLINSSLLIKFVVRTALYEIDIYVYGHSCYLFLIIFVIICDTSEHQVQDVAFLYSIL